MNPIEIEEQLSKVAFEPFDAQEFPFQFLECFGNKITTIKSLRKGKANIRVVTPSVDQKISGYCL